MNVFHENLCVAIIPFDADVAVICVSEKLNTKVAASLCTPVDEKNVATERFATIGDIATALTVV